MNIFKWITGRAGKVALSAMQAVGLSAVVGVAGIAAWQYLDSPAENNSFAPAAYNPGEVVYVAGANTGSYAGGSYAGGGESQSSVQISANTLKRLEQQDTAQRAAQEMKEYSPEYSPSASSVPSQAYQMGETEGLGMGANIANEFDLKNNPMAAMQQQMAGISSGMSNVIAQAQQQAQQQGQTGGAEAAAGAPTLASASKNWSSSGTTGGGSGNAFNSSFAIQDSGKNKKGGSAGDAIKQAGDMMASAQAQMAKVSEGARMRAQATFGSENIGGNHDASVQGFRSSKEGKDLEFIHKRSNDASKNKNRAANEGSRAFLASTKISGGMMISAENVTTGQGQGSKDFSADTQKQLRGIGVWQTDTVEPDVQQRKKDRDDLRTWLWIAVPTALALIPWIGAAADVARILSSNPFTAALAAVFWALAAALAVIALIPNIVLLVKSIGYANKYGGSSLSTWAGIISGILTAAVPCAVFIPGVSKLLGSMKVWMALVAPVIGLGASWLTTGLTKDAALDDPESLLNTDIDADQGADAGGSK